MRCKRGVSYACETAIKKAPYPAHISQQQKKEVILNRSCLSGRGSLHEILGI